jgi:hypothetical protein
LALYNIKVLGITPTTTLFFSPDEMISTFFMNNRTGRNFYHTELHTAAALEIRFKILEYRGK